MKRTIAWATLVAGGLDILMAIIDTTLSGGSVPRMLRSIASGPFGDGMRDGALGAPVGLLVHFAIMAVIAAVYVLAARSISALARYWWIAGPIYGLGVWLVMYWIVLPLRFETFAPPSEAMPIVKQLISHCLLTGLPIAWITARSQRSIRPSYI
jgi:hypothetical protein